jgi:signal transduction histidine kinase
MIKVEDNGVGFDPAELKPNIGLSNVRQRVEALGGSWWVDSTPGRGTSIAFELVDREGVAA